MLRTQLIDNQYLLQIQSQQQIFKNELAKLKFLIGVQEAITIESTDNFIFNLPTDVDSIMQYALTNRSDILRLKSTIDVANANIKRQKAFAYPTPELGAIYNPQNTIPYIGFYGTIQIPIFSRNQGEIQKSNFIKHQAQQDLLSTQLKLQTDVMISYETYETQKQNLEGYYDIINQSTEILKSVKYAYLRGGTSIIDFLEAQRSWITTQQQYYDALQIYKQSYIQLLYTTGLINQIAQ